MSFKFDITVTDFKGLRKDRGQKYLSKDYLYDIENFNFDSIVGMNTVKCPSKANFIPLDLCHKQTVYGIYEFEYLKNSNDSKLLLALCQV